MIINIFINPKTEKEPHFRDKIAFILFIDHSIIAKNKLIDNILEHMKIIISFSQK